MRKRGKEGEGHGSYLTALLPFTDRLTFLLSLQWGCSCSGLGECLAGFCKCPLGRWGMDCSRSKAFPMNETLANQTFPSRLEWKGEFYCRMCRPNWSQETILGCHFM